VDKRFEPLATGEVLSVDESVQILIGHRTFRAGELAQAIKTQLEYGIQGWSPDKDAWFSEEGIPCEVLRFTAQGWQKGKVRINLEFCPLDGEEEATQSKQEASAGEKEAAANLDEQTVFAMPAPDISDELDLDESLTSMPDDFELETSSTMDNAAAVVMEETFIADDGTVVMEETFIATQSEFELETPTDEALGWEQEESNDFEFEMEPESSTATAFPDDEADEFDMAQMSTSLDDEFDQITESIEQELEEVEGATDSEDDLLDLGEVSSEASTDIDFGDISADSGADIDFGDISADSGADIDFEDISADSGADIDFEDMSADSGADIDFEDMSADSGADIDFGDLSADGEADIDFGDLSADGGEGEFQFEDFNEEELEDEGSDSLLDDVWQDINQPSWQNNQ
jgi:hypothetical protein